MSLWYSGIIAFQVSLIVIACVTLTGCIWPQSVDPDLRIECLELHFDDNNNDQLYLSLSDHNAHVHSLWRKNLSDPSSRAEQLCSSEDGYIL